MSESPPTSHQNIDPASISWLEKYLADNSASEYDGFPVSNNPPSRPSETRQRRPSAAEDDERPRQRVRLGSSAPGTGPTGAESNVSPLEPLGDIHSEPDAILMGNAGPFNPRFGTDLHLAASIPEDENAKQVQRYFHSPHIPLFAPAGSAGQYGPVTGTPQRPSQTMSPQSAGLLPGGGHGQTLGDGYTSAPISQQTQPQSDLFFQPNMQQALPQSDLFFQPNMQQQPLEYAQHPLQQRPQPLTYPLHTTPQLHYTQSSSLRLGAPVQQYQYLSATNPSQPSASPAPPPPQFSTPPQSSDRQGVNVRHYPLEKLKEIPSGHREYCDPSAKGKWWYRDETNIDRLKWYMRTLRHHNHIVRIMETDLGHMRALDERCMCCRDEGFECWVYSEAACRHMGTRARTYFKSQKCAVCLHKDIKCFSSQSGENN